MKTRQLTKKTIPARYWEELNNSGHTVPREMKHGTLIPFVVGKNYTIVNEETKEELTARCTQDCPYHLVLID